MTEDTARAGVVGVAKTYLGYKESDGTHKELIDIYNAHLPLARGYALKYTDPWCAAFVSAVAIVSGITDFIPTECSCTKQIRLFEKLGRFDERDDCVPMAGDLLYYDWDAAGDKDSRAAVTADHVGIVEKVEGDTITVIEGNCSHAVKRRTVKVGSRNICGCARPDYAAVAQRVNGEPAAAAEQPASADDDGGETAKQSCAVRLPVLSRGTRGEAVRAAQLLLNLRDAALEPDGSFGPLTDAAVKEFQTRLNGSGTACAADGIIGPITWRALVGA